MSRFSDYLSSMITPQMTLLEKFNKLLEFLKENNYISVFYSSENYNPNTRNYQIGNVNTLNYELRLGDCIVFSNGYYAFVETLGEETFTIGNILYFQGEQGVSVVSATINSSGSLVLTLSNGTTVNAGNTGAVKDFIIDTNQHLIVRYLNGTSNDLGAIFNGDIILDGTLTATRVYGSKIEDIKDLNNNNRFVEGLGTINSAQSGFTNAFCKWSLSGTHLMFVLAGTFEDETVIPNVRDLVEFSVPDWIYNKIYPVWSSYLENKTIPLYNTSWGKQTIDMALLKDAGKIKIRLIGGLTLTDTRSFRVQFDLLIDNE